MPKSEQKKISNPRLKQHYIDNVCAELQKKFNYENVSQIPKILKVTLNMGVGEAANDKKIVKSATAEMKLIAGQEPVVTYVRKSIAGFKIRDGWPIGCKVTLRRERMFEFLDRLISISLPGTRDFRGLNPKAFDGQGNFTMGVKEQIMFPEIDFDKVDTTRGMDICITTSARNQEEGLALLTAMKFPFRKQQTTKG